jgi:hypothetical protein
MVPKFLIDECLSPDLAALARERGFFESSHVTWLGKAGWKDWELKQFILEQDWTAIAQLGENSGGQKPGPRDMGAAMKLVQQRILATGLRADGKLVSELVKAELAK